MSYANGTTYYNLPQTVGTDKRDWTDTNQAFADIDSAVHTAVETGATGAQDIATIKEQLHGTGGIDERLAQAENDIDAVEGDVAILQATVTQHTAAITDVRQDLEDMICAFNEEAATSTHAYAIDDYFIYNDVLYKATDAIAIGDTIVPNVNCAATNVATELFAIEHGTVTIEVDADEVDYDNTTSGLTATNVQAAIDELANVSPSTITASDVTYDDSVTQLSAANVQAAIAALKTLIDNIPSGGGDMPLFDYANPLFTFDATHLTYTVPNNAADCYLIGTLDVISTSSSNEITLDINGTVMFKAYKLTTPTGTSFAECNFASPLRLTAGDVVTISEIGNSDLHIVGVR